MVFPVSAVYKQKLFCKSPWNRLQVRMRVLLDENVDRRLRRLFDPEHEVVTVAEHGWSGTKNGDLLRLAEEEFDALVTMDKNIQYQQQLVNFDLVVVLITARSNRKQAVAPIMPKINRALREEKRGELQVVAA